MARHLLTVWNPSYAEDALDAHLRVLLRWAERSRDPADAATPEEDVYVWWAKIRSPRRDGELPHAAEIAAIQSQIDDDVETHLYLTDYRSLYVGQLGEVTADAVLEEEGEAEHAPSYYRGMEADFWFRLWDLRRLVADDTPGVIEALGRLRNTRYHDRPVSLYGGMVELPLIVTRDDGARWFADRDLLTSGRLWAERDADLRVDTQRLARELPDNRSEAGSPTPVRPGRLGVVRDRHPHLPRLRRGRLPRPPRRPRLRLLRPRRRVRQGRGDGAERAGLPAAPEAARGRNAQGPGGDRRRSSPGPGRARRPPVARDDPAPAGERRHRRPRARQRVQQPRTPAGSGATRPGSSAASWTCGTRPRTRRR